MTDIAAALRVYIVEDSAIMLKLLVAAVQSAGAQLLGTSDNAQQAVREIPDLQPDLILLDIALRSGTGFDVLQVLQAGRLVPKAIKVVFTNHVTGAHREDSYRLGATHFFDKSTEGWQALDLINRMAAEKRTRAAGGVPERREPNGHR